MSDPINFYNRALGGMNVSGGSRNAAVNKSESAADTAGANGTAGVSDNEAAMARASAPRDESLDLSETARRSMSDPSFDRGRVEAIKTALREGNYPLDSRRIAESFVALERLIQD